MLEKRYFDWLNLILGVWVLISPWALGFASMTGAMWTGVVMGILLIIGSAWTLYQPDRRQVEWVNLVLGIVLFVAPWVVAYQGAAAAAWNSWILGAVVALIAAYTMTPSARTPGHPVAH